MTRQVVLWVWAAVAAAMVGSELAARIRGARPRVANIVDVLAVLSSKTWRLVPVFVAWMWLGWHLFAR